MLPEYSHIGRFANLHRQSCPHRDPPHTNSRPERNTRVRSPRCAKTPALARQSLQDPGNPARLCPQAYRTSGIISRARASARGDCSTVSGLLQKYHTPSVGEMCDSNRCKLSPPHSVLPAGLPEFQGRQKITTPGCDSVYIARAP